ncbi:MAG: peptidylprolyl isomerase [Kiritimatiellia bacterium]
MKRVFRPIFLVAMLGCALGGCGRSDSPPTAAARDVFAERPDVAMAVVDGARVTVGDYRARCRIELWMYKRRRPNLADAALRQFVASRSDVVLPELMNQRLIDRYLAAAGVAFDEAQMDKAVAAVWARIGEKRPPADVAAEIGVPEAFLRRQFAAPAMVEAAVRAFDPDSAKISEAEIDAGLARQAAYAERARATNALNYAACSNALARVRAGEDFAAVGSACGQQDTDEAAAWGDFEPDELDSEALRAWAFTAPVGSVGGPFELEDGLSIVKILAREAGTLADSLASKGVASVSLARITFRLADEEPEPRTRAHVRKALLNWKAKQAQKALFADLHGKMKVDYPNGRNFRVDPASVQWR